MVYEAKTKPTEVAVTEFLETVDERKHADALVLLDLFERITGDPAHMWGPSIIGFGNYHYKYDSGHEGDAPRAGFSPRKAKHSIYLICGYSDAETEKTMAELRGKLGKHSMGKSCLYINKLSDVDIDVLGEMIRVNAAWMDTNYPR